MVPTKLDAAIVPEFPATAQGIIAPPEGTCQLARPVASETSIFPFHGEPPVIFNCPLISSFAVGAEIPIPIFPPLPYIQFPIES